MRRIAIGLVFLLGACAEKTEQQALTITWNNGQNALSTEQRREWPAEMRLEQVNWTPAARGLKASTLQFPEIADPPAADAARLERFTPAENRSLSANADRLNTLNQLSTQLERLHFAEDNRLTKSAPVTFPAEWLQ